jgi:hypothetical protein
MRRANGVRIGADKTSGDIDIPLASAAQNRSQAGIVVCPALWRKRAEKPGGYPRCHNNHSPNNKPAQIKRRVTKEPHRSGPVSGVTPDKRPS